MRIFGVILCLISFIVTPVLADSNDFSQYKYDSKQQIKYKQYEDSRGAFSNFSVETLIGLPKTGKGFVIEGDEIPIPGDNTYGRPPSETQLGVKIAF